MDVLLLSTYDIAGGAARAAYRLHQGLQSIGVNSQMLVQEKSSADKAVFAPTTRLAEGIAHAKLTFDTLPLKFYRQREQAPFSVHCLPDQVAPKVAQLNPSLINLHWISGAYLQVETLAKLNRPLVWTLHDMWAFTGGCHYSHGCDRYTLSCGACPQLHSNREADLSRWIWNRKVKAWKKLDLTIVALSDWLAKSAASSALFKDCRVEIIPNGLDTSKYRPIPQKVARELLGLPQDKQLILFGSLQATDDKRKGFHLLQPALQSLNQAGWQDKVELVVLGASQPDNPPNFGSKIHYLGTLNDDLSLAMVYSAADVFVLPSTQENLANTVMEALACGTPCVAFNIGGMPDMIEHCRNGYLAKPFEIEDLAKGLVWVIEDEERQQQLSDRSREKVVQEFTQDIQARRYQALFTEILSSKNRLS